MCGICGTIGVTDERSTAAVHRMMRAMPHRGPDDEGFERSAMGSAGEVCLGFRRLSILDLTWSGHQPMFDPVTGNCLVFNGEIYNFKELRNRLRAQGVTFRSSGDTEVLLACLTAWGERALDQVDGMFALVFLDAANSRVLLARDHLGIKPLYISWQKKHLLFSSEVRSLLASGFVARDLDPAGVASFLAFGAPQDPQTVHREVQSFPAGCYQWIRLDQQGYPHAEKTPSKHWGIPAPRDNEVRNWDKTPSLIRELFLRTVQEQCQADVPVGVLLSAGIDSTIIAAAAASAGIRLRSFSVGVEDGNRNSELAVARRTAAHLGAEHHEFVLSEGTISEYWEGWLRSVDRPSVDGFNTFLACKAIHGSCVKVALSGLGADEVFGGYGSFTRVPRLRNLLLLGQWLPRSARRKLAQTVTSLGGQSLRRQAWRLDLLAGTRTRAADVAIMLKRLLGDAEMQSLGFDPATLGLMESFLPHEAVANIPFDAKDPFVAVSRAELLLYTQNTLLRDSDANSMAHSLELRVPFLGRRFVEAGFGVPSSMHIDSQGVGKQVLRNAFADLVPREVLKRPKTGFALPFDRWMFTSLRDSCEAAIEGLRQVPFLNYASARGMWENFRSNPTASHWLRPMLLVALGSYVDANSRTFIDDAGAIKIRAKA
jgi:asparagine synthase (glutamine-hydrolysing)